MARIHVVANQKGGVGKSTAAVNLAAVTADVHKPRKDGSRSVLVVSCDPQGSAPWWADRVGDELPFHFAEAFDADAILGLRHSTDYDDIFIDTPGWFPPANPKHPERPWGTTETADILEAVFEVADQVIVPIECEPLCYIPTTNTVEFAIAPRGLPYTVFVNNWEVRDGFADRDGTIEFVDAQGWNRAETVVRHYKVHARAAADGVVVTQYPKNRVSLEAAQDFYRLAMELGLGAKPRATHTKTKAV
ncbi:chromosome-partitioning ATPase Soj [Embleya hyalina]|uniref:Chromosome-partitioning ATPase Soj n=1 Tax=Embleya hyalina TaxID=516124 RepID=A0A401YZ42_9ACTN|nr:chromosome-partitioning ATPase Soj [Embleya hyalina]